MFIEELRSSVNLLMANLESMPVSKGGEFKLQKLKRGHNTSIMDMGQEDENTLSKSDVVLSFTLEVGHFTKQCKDRRRRYSMVKLPFRLCDICEVVTRLVVDCPKMEAVYPLEAC